MKPIVCISCEGNETKIAVFSKDKEGIKIHNTSAVRLTHGATASAEAEKLPDISMDDMAEDISFDSVGDSDSQKGTDASDISAIASTLVDIKLNKSQFIPILTEPSVNYHIYDGEKFKDKNKLLDAIINDISRAKNITIRRDYVDYIELNEDKLFCVFIEGEIPCVSMVDSLAEFGGRKFYRIPTLKSAEISLAHYVSKTIKFYPEDYSLIIYTGKDYSKLIFLEGQKLKHIGTTLDIGTENLHTYDVYFSKILLEMENGGIPRLDNVILCGDDQSENLVLSFYGSFPEANVTELKFEDFDISSLNDEDQAKLSAFSIPISSAVDYFDEQDDGHKGINILPKYIQEKQKFFQFGWHSLAVLPLLFAATVFFTYTIMSNSQEIKELDKEIVRLTELQVQNRIIADQITTYSERIANFDNTLAILDAATSGTEVWGEMIDKVANFIERRRNFWISKLETVAESEIKLSGYSLSRSALTEFADYNNSSLLINVMFEPLREKNAFAYSLNFKLFKELVDTNGP